MKRKALSRKQSKRNFRKGNHIAKINLKAAPMRGGFRI